MFHMNLSPIVSLNWSFQTKSAVLGNFFVKNDFVFLFLHFLANFAHLFHKMAEKKLSSHSAFRGICFLGLPRLQHPIRGAHLCIMQCPYPFSLDGNIGIIMMNILTQPLQSHQSWISSHPGNLKRGLMSRKLNHTLYSSSTLFWIEAIPWKKDSSTSTVYVKNTNKINLSV